MYIIFTFFFDLFFVVLKSPDIPSLLVETGFISNPNEEQALTEKHYQQKLADAITAGIVEYFDAHPPRGTLLSQRNKPIRYVVKAGDSLSKIASIYNTSIHYLQRYNKLPSTTLKVNQVLLIPNQS